MNDAYIDAIIKNESAGDPNAVSPRGARGLMQIEPSTAETYGVDPSTLSNPDVNKALGTRYFNDLLQRYNGNPRLALAAYNWGPEHVDKVGDDPSKWPEETRKYVPRVMADAANNVWGNFKPDEGSASPSANPWADFQPDSDKPADKLETMLAMPTMETGDARGKTAIKQERAASAEQERAKIEGGSSDMSDPFVENATIAAVTAGLGVPLGFGWAPATAAGKLLSVPLGTAEQYLYGWASEKAGRWAANAAAQSGNPAAQKLAPYIGGAAGLGAALATGGIESRLGSAAAGLRSLPAAQEAAARTAATEAEQGVREGLPEKLYQYGQKVGEAGEKASEKTAQAVAPAMAQEQMSKFLGRTPEESRSVLDMEPEDYALHRANMRNVVYGPINRISDELGKQFDAAAEGKLNNPAKVDSIASTVADELGWLNEHGKAMSKPVRDLVAQIPHEVAEPTESQLADVLSGESDKVTQARFTDLYDRWVRTHPNVAVSQEEQRRLAADALSGVQGNPTVGQLLGWRSQATKLAASQSDHNQVVALQLRDAIDKSLEDSGIEIPRKLKEQWGTYKSVFNPAFRRKVATAANPTDYGEHLFTNPKRALTVLDNATPDEKDSLRQLFADYVNSKRMTPMALGRKKIDPRVLKDIAGDTPYQNFKPWMETPAKAMAWESARAGNPAIDQLGMRGFEREMSVIAEERAAKVREAGINLAKSLGPAGRGKLARILAVRDPVAAAQVVEREFPISPEQAQEVYRQAQMNPAEQAINSVREAKMIEQGLDINKQREEAAVAELMNAPHSNTAMAAYKRRLYGWHLPMFLGEMAMGATVGHATGGMPGMYQGAIAGMIFGMMAGNKLRSLFRVALSDPEAATQYWRAIDMAPSTLNASKFGARMARVATAVVMQDYDKQEKESRK